MNWQKLHDMNQLDLPSDISAPFSLQSRRTISSNPLALQPNFQFVCSHFMILDVYKLATEAKYGK